MSGWAQQSIGVAYLALHHGIDRVHRATSCVERCFKRAWAEWGVLLHLAPGTLHRSPRGTSTYARDVFTRMIDGDLILAGHSRRDWLHHGRQA